MNDFDDLEELPEAKIRNAIEYKIHIAIVEHHKTAFPHVKLVHVPNQTKDAQEGYFKKLMGAVPGAHDFFIFWGPPLGCGIYDAKKPDEKLATNQNKFASAMHHFGVKTAYGSSVRHYHETLKSWGLIPVHNAIKEPDTRSDTQKKTDAFNMYKK